jgi:UDP-N-acetylmuramate dehydrogenase
MGDAEVSEKHANFIVNRGRASFDDVTGLMEAVKDTVYGKTGILLEPEIEIWRSAA